MNSVDDKALELQEKCALRKIEREYGYLDRVGRKPKIVQELQGRVKDIYRNEKIKRKVERVMKVEHKYITAPQLHKRMAEAQYKKHGLRAMWDYISSQGGLAGLDRQTREKFQKWMEDETS